MQHDNYSSHLLSVQSEISEKLAAMFNVDTLECISVFGFRTQVRSPERQPWRLMDLIWLLLMFDEGESSALPLAYCTSAI